MMAPNILGSTKAVLYRHVLPDEVYKVSKKSKPYTRDPEMEKSITQDL